MKSYLALILLSGVFLGTFTACERSKRYIYSWSERIITDHRFSHTLNLEQNRIRFQIQPPQILQSCHTRNNLTVAFHYRINDGEIMTRFLSPKFPTFALFTDIGPPNTEDRLSYYFSFMIHEADERVQLSIDSRWFHHKAPLHKMHSSTNSLRCQELVATSNHRQQIVKDKPLEFFDKHRTADTTHFSCQPAVSIQFHTWLAIA